MKLIELIGKLNQKYDQMEEPWRFLTAVILTLPAIVALGSGLVGIRAIAAAWVLALVYVRIWMR